MLCCYTTVPGYGEGWILAYMFNPTTSYMYAPDPIQHGIFVFRSNNFHVLHNDNFLFLLCSLDVPLI